MAHRINSTSVITGAGGGLGRALAIQLAMSGVRRLHLCDIDGSALAETANAVRHAGALAETSVIDVANSGQVEGFAAGVVAKSGVPYLVVNNAGVSLTGTFDRISMDDLEWIMGINFFGVVNGCRAFIPAMVAAGRGHLVNVSSIYGVIGVPGCSAYSAAKFAVRGFSEAIGFELDAKGVKVSVAIPGGIRTGIVRNGRFLGLDHYPDATRESIAQHFEKIAGLSPEDAARKLLAGILLGKKRILIGKDARFIDFVQRTMPNQWSKLILPLLTLPKPRTQQHG